MLWLIPAYGMADRAWGSLPRAVSFPFGLLVAGLACWLIGWQAGLTGLLWLGYRSLPFFHSSLAPHKGEYGYAFARHAFGILCGLPLVLSLGPKALASFTAYAGAAGAMASSYGLWRDYCVAHSKLDPWYVNTGIESVRGLLFGLAFWAALHGW